MKRYLCILLCICMLCPMLLTACGSGGNGKYQTDTDTAPVETKPPRAEGEPKATVSVPFSEIGYKVALATSGDEKIVTATVGDGVVVISSFKRGRTVVTTKNDFGEAAKITVSVDIEGNITYSVRPYTQPKGSVNVLDFGAKSGENCTEAFQKAMDSLKNGGTVYVPAGIYYISQLAMREGINLRLAGLLPEYNTPYTPEINTLVTSGKSFAVIRCSSGVMFLNHDAYDWGRNGAGNFTISGGVLDMQGSSNAFILSCAKDITIENTIFKDATSGHAIQMGGCDGVRVRNVMFAGQRSVTDTGGGELIQIEQTHPGAMGSEDNTLSPYEKYENWSTKNVVFDNCYFGRSMAHSAPNHPIGHHGHDRIPSAIGITIKNCTFDNPRVSAIRACGWEQMEISGCTFISDNSSVITDEEVYMIELKFHRGSMKKDDAYLCTDATRGGLNNISIHDNTFILNKSSMMSGIVANTTNGDTVDAKAYSDIKIYTPDNGLTTSFTGYQMMTGKVFNISVYNNDITVNNSKGTCLYKFSTVDGLTVENNTLHTKRNYQSSQLGGKTVVGGNFSNCTSADEAARNLTVNANPNNTTVPVIMTGAQKRTEVFAIGTAKSVVLNFNATEGGTVERSIDNAGVLYVTPKAKDGYLFDGYYLNGEKVDADRLEFSKTTTIELRFVKK